MIQLRSDTHLRADFHVARFGDYLRKMAVRQVPMMRPETAIARSGRQQRFRKVNIRTSVATDRFLYRGCRNRQVIEVRRLRCNAARLNFTAVGIEIDVTYGFG